MRSRIKATKFYLRVVAARFISLRRALPVVGLMLGLAVFATVITRSQARVNDGGDGFGFTLSNILSSTESDTARVTDSTTNPAEATVMAPSDISCPGSPIKVWDGGGTTNNWSEAANWCNNTLPTSGEIARFDGASSKDVTIDAGISVLGIQINSGYTGTMTQASGVDIAVGSSGFVQSVGMFVGDSGNVTINGTFALSGGSFTAPTGALSVVRFNTTGGAFTHNGGTVVFTGSSVDNFVNISPTLNHLIVNKDNNAFFTLFNGELTVTGTLTLADGRYLFGGMIAAQGAVSVGPNFDGGGGPLSITGSAPRTITLAAGTQLLPTMLNAPNVTVETSGSGTLNWQSLTLQAGTINQGAVNFAFSSAYTQSGGTFNGSSNAIFFGNGFAQSNGTFNGGSGDININGTFGLSGGAFTAPSGTLSVVRFNTTGGTFAHNGGTVVFTGVSVDNFANTSPTLNHLTVNKDNNAFFNLFNGNLVVTGALTLTDGRFDPNGGGGLVAQGPVTVGANFDGGSGPLSFTGSDPQVFTNNGGANTSGSWTINKTGDTVTAASSLILPTSTALNITNGTLYLASGSNLTSGAITIGANGRLVNDSATTITLGGNLANSGRVDLQGGGAACPEADTILIRSSVEGTQRSWTAQGAGAFRLADVDVKDMGGSGTKTVYSGTNSGGNNASWVFDNNCPTTLSISPSVVSLGINQTQTFTAGGGFAPRTFSLFVNNSGATINPTTGLYTAGTTVNVSDTVRVTDAFGSTADATVNIFGPPHHLAFTTQPSNSTAGQNITPAVQVVIQDQFNNTVANATNAVTIAIGTNPGCPTNCGTLSGTTTLNAAAGIATFNNLGLNRAGTGYTLVASSGSLILATSDTFNVTFAEAAQLAFRTHPANTLANSTIVPPVEVEVRDQFGNLVTTATNPVSLAIGNNPGCPTTCGVLSGTSPRDAVGGIATFNNLSINNFGNGYTLVATSNPLALATSNAFNIISPFAVTNTNNSGTGSLRQAIINANNTPNTPAPQTISFHIAGTAPFTIPAIALPTITDPVVIDATTQPGYVGSPIVELNGSFNSIVGLEISAGNTTVKGLVINRFYTGILLRDNGGNTIQRNYIGTNIAGDLGQGNGAGIFIDNSPNNLIGGNTAGERNVISGNEGGVDVWDAASNGTIIKGNYIGINASGTGAVPNQTGIRLFSTTDITIGGAQTGERNVISGNSITGIYITIFDQSNSTVANINIKNNYIGTDASGTAAIANGYGIFINNQYGFANANITDITIGGTQSGEGNLISSNLFGICTQGKLTNLNIKGNYIGTDVSGANSIPNAIGVAISESSLSSNTPNNVSIGGTQNGESNIIAFSIVTGVWIKDGSTGVSVRGNSIHSNYELDGFLGIDLAPIGFNGADYCDADTGPNQRQNPPVLNSVFPSGGNTTIEGLLHTAANQTYTLDFYSNETCDFYGRGEGKVYLGSKEITSGSSCGSAGTPFSATVPVAVAATHQVVATATDAQGNTSEFSLCVGPNAKIEGTVLDSSTNQPIQGVQVELVDLTQAEPQPRYYSTNASGRFIFDKLPLGKNYRVTSKKANYSFSPSSRTYNNLSTNHDDIYSGTRDKLKIIGRATLNGATLSDVAMAISGGGNAPSAVINTNLSGQFAFNNLIAGTYTITPSKPGYLFTPPSATVSITSDHTVDFTAAPDLQTTLTGRITFIDSPSLKAMNADGSGIVTLVAGVSRTVVSANLSKDGTKVVLARHNDEFRKINFDGSGDQSLPVAVNGGPFIELWAPVLSPDKSKIAFHGKKVSFPNYFGIFTADINGGLATHVLQNVTANHIDPSWSPDGSRLVFSRAGNIYTIDPDGSNLSQLTNNSLLEDEPTWSPDGNKIAFLRHSAAGASIVVMNTNGSNETTIVPSAPIAEVYWSPDSTRLLFNRIDTLFSVLANGAGGEIDLGKGRGASWGTSNSVITPIGTPVTIGSGLLSLTFPGVNGLLAPAGGEATTTITPISPASAGDPPSGFNLANFAYDISTTASFTPPVSVCFNLEPGLYTTQAQFDKLRVLHNEGGVLVDRTVLPNDFVSRKICSSVNSLGAFVLAELEDPAQPSVRGLVVDQNGNPLTDIPISLSGDEERFTSTDLDGSFIFANLAQGGNYTVQPTKTGYLFNLPFRSYISITGEETVVFTATAADFDISGTVRDQNHNALANVTITLNGGEQETTTDAAGNYTFVGLPANGTFSLTAFKSGLSFTPSQVSLAPLTSNLTEINFTGSTACTISLISTSQSFTASGGAGSINITAPAGCNWNASSNNPDFLTITSSSSGSGNTTLSYSVAPHSNTSNRTGTITIANQTFTVFQGAAFLDVPPSHPFYTEIGKLSARGVTLGCGDGNYCPDQAVTREQMAAFIMRVRGEFNPPTPATQRFDDVPPTHPFYNFIDRMALLQITLGCGSNPPLYCPGNPVLREQMAAFIIRALHEPGYLPPPPSAQRFNDVPPSNPFYAHIEEMAMRGITLGCGGNPPLYCPTQAVTRAQMAAFLVRAFIAPQE
jgi:hypothetical protein